MRCVPPGCALAAPAGRPPTRRTRRAGIDQSPGPCLTHSPDRACPDAFGPPAPSERGFLSRSSEVVPSGRPETSAGMCPGKPDRGSGRDEKGRRRRTIAEPFFAATSVTWCRPVGRPVRLLWPGPLHVGRARSVPQSGPRWCGRGATCASSTLDSTPWCVPLGLPDRLGFALSDGPARATLDSSR
jgi:hypothetical protein